AGNAGGTARADFGEALHRAGGPAPVEPVRVASDPAKHHVRPCRDAPAPGHARAAGAGVCEPRPPGRPKRQAAPGFRRRIVRVRWYLGRRVVAKSGLADVCGLQSLRTAGDVELHGLTLGKRLEAVALNRREVHENVLSTLLGNEAKSLGLVEPLHRAT